MSEDTTWKFTDTGEADPNIRWLPDENYYAQLTGLYANMLSAHGINLMDPTKANMTRFNRTGRKHMAELPYLGRTYVFITRPDMNFDGGDRSGFVNVRQVQMFDFFSRTEIGIRCFPWLMYHDGFRSVYVQGERSTKKVGLVNIPKDSMIATPFHIPLINMCTATQGGKDFSLEKYETEGDQFGNKLQYAKGADDTFGPGTLTLEFEDMWGSPGFISILLWVYYIFYLTRGVVRPRTVYEMERIIDYTCSIYIFLVDRDGESILRWCKYTGAYPSSVPMQNINHNMSPDIDALRKLSIPFEYNMFEPMNPKTLADFNFLVEPYFGSMLNAMKPGSLKPDENYPYSQIDSMKNFAGGPQRRVEIPDGSDSMSQRFFSYMYEEHTRIPKFDLQSYLNDAELYYPKKLDKDGRQTNIAVGIDDQDRTFWGHCPYIHNHKLIWI